jgi:hypothetical protein
LTDPIEARRVPPFVTALSYRSRTMPPPIT